MEEEGPTMLELMMASQKEAMKLKEDAISSSIGQTFKKGFLTNKKKLEKKNNETVNFVKKNQTLSTGILSSSSDSIPTIKKKEQSFVFDEVQEAMKKEETPILQQIKSGEWMTPDLILKFQQNPIVSKGLQHPKCMAAMQLMQQNPNEAKKRFASDPEVDIFMREFGKLMSDHFNSLAVTQESNSLSAEPVKPIQELGPLQCQAIARSKNPNTSADIEKVGEAQVKQVLDDPELRGLLMDPMMQQILQDCSNPQLFQKHMSNATTAKKIQKLYQAGLVGTTR